MYYYWFTTEETWIWSTIPPCFQVVNFVFPSLATSVTFCRDFDAYISSFSRLLELFSVCWASWSPPWHPPIILAFTIFYFEISHINHYPFLHSTNSQFSSLIRVILFSLFFLNRVFGNSSPMFFCWSKIPENKKIKRA